MQRSCSKAQKEGGAHKKIISRRRAGFDQKQWSLGRRAGRRVRRLGGRKIRWAKLKVGMKRGRSGDKRGEKGLVADGHRSSSSPLSGKRGVCGLGFFWGLYFLFCGGGLWVFWLREVGWRGRGVGRVLVLGGWEALGLGKGGRSVGVGFVGVGGLFCGIWGGFSFLGGGGGLVRV